MPIRSIAYKGLRIQAAAFEVTTLGRFVSTLAISRNLNFNGGGETQLFSPPCPDGFFESVDQALEVAVAYGRAIIDGEVPGVSLADS